MSKKKKQTMGAKCNKLIKKISGFYKKDENGKVDRVGGICFIFILLLPFVIIEGVKLGFYAKYTRDGPMEVIINGLSMSLFSVLSLRKQAADIGFGMYEASFKWVYLELLFLGYGILFASTFIAADRNKDRDNKKDGDMEFGKIDEFNEEMAVCNEFGVPYDPPEDDYNPGNMILSNRVRYALEPSGTNTYSCALVIGATGCGKSYTYVKPNILQMNSSYIVTDPKGELTSDLGLALMNNGYNVKVFNINEPEYSCKYNPFHYIRSEEDVISAVNVFLDNTNETDTGSGDPFFPLAEKNFYLALFFYIYTVYKDEPEKQTFKTIYEIYQGANEQETQVNKGEPIPDSPFDKIFKQLAKDDPSNPSLQYYSTFKKGSNKTKQSILISVGVKLWFMSVPSIANLMSGDTLELDKIGDRKTAVFVIIPAEKKTFRFLSAMLFTQMFETLYYVGNTLNEKSFLLQKGSCVALRSDPFVAGTQSEKDAKQKLLNLQAMYMKAEIEDDNKLMLTDEAIKAKFDKVDENGMKPFPKVRLVYKNDLGQKIVLEEFQSRRACEMVLDAAINGKIVPGVKELSNHVRFMLDEFYNVGCIDGFDLKIATFRSLRISADIIIQSIAQLKEMYEDRESKITNNCSVQILLGAGSLEDCQYFSDLIGQTTVKSESVSINHKGLIPGADNVNMSDGAKMLLRPEQIRIMNKDKCLIVVATKMPLQDSKYESKKHKYWDKTFSSHDVEKTLKNRFEFRRLFKIKQEDKNKIVTIIPEDTVVTGNKPDNKKNRNPIKGKDPDLEPFLEHEKARNEAANKVGIDNKPSIEDVNAEYEEARKKAMSMNEPGNTGFDVMNTTVTNNKTSSMMAFSAHSWTKPENIKTVPKVITDNDKVKLSQVISSDFMGDATDDW